VVTVLRDITQEVEMARMKDEFVSMVSHELRTPLTSVLGFARLIHKQFTRTLQPRIAIDDEKGQGAARRVLANLEIIVAEGERLTRLINNVLDLAKMESGRVEWEMVQVTLGEIIVSSVSAARSLARQKGLTIEVDVAEGLPPLDGDRDRLVQVVTNLLSNAIKFTDTGQITVRAWLLAPGDSIPPFGVRQADVDLGWPASAPLLAVSVTDTGIGIAEADLPKVFEKFHQVRDRNSETQRPGTGLGLSICRQIVTHHGGHIWVESRPGQGSRFVFTLPLTRD
jgi:signal transduction histidine kinase